MGKLGQNSEGLAVIGGRASEMALESLGEGESVIISHAVRDLIDTYGFIRKEFNGHLHPVCKEIILKGVAGSLLEEAGQITPVKP